MVLYLSFRTCYEVDIRQLCSSSIHKYRILINIVMSDSVHSKRSNTVKDELYISALEQLW